MDKALHNLDTLISIKMKESTATETINLKEYKNDYLKIPEAEDIITESIALINDFCNSFVHIERNIIDLFYKYRKKLYRRI